MKNSIIADLIRIQKKISFIVLLGVQLVFLAGVEGVSMIIKLGDDTSKNFEMFTGLGAGPMALLIGIPVFLAIYSDDFKSHAMQTAIGRGLSRSKLVWARFIEVVLVIFESTLAVTIVQTGMALIVGVNASTIGSMCLDRLVDMMTMISSITMFIILVYGMQSAVLALVMYILVGGGFVSGVLASISALAPFLAERNIHLEYITPGTLISSLAINPAYNYGWAIWLLVVVVYIIIPVWLTTVVFKKKELEF